MTTDISNQNCRVCYRSAISSQSIIFSKEIEGVQVGENYYYCSSICRYADKRKRIETFSALLIVIAAFFVIIQSFAFGMLIGLFGLVVLGYAEIRYPRMNEQYVENHSNPAYYVQQDPGEMDLEGLEELEMELEEMDQNEIAITDMVPNTRNPNNDIAQRLNPENSKQVYSEILEKYVDPCCYQTARLEDKYCMCGKAIEYPVET